jgi:hypothetical protein
VSGGSDAHSRQYEAQPAASRVTPAGLSSGGIGSAAADTGCRRRRTAHAAAARKSGHLSTLALNVNVGFRASRRQIEQTAAPASTSLAPSVLCAWVDMSNSEIVALVEELEGLGVKFTVVPRLDGSLRLNTWRTQNSWPNRERINRLLAERIESSPEVAAQIAEWVGARSAEAASDASRG